MSIFEELNKLYEEVIELDTSYMLRNDGKLISCKDLAIHPYINKLSTSTKNIKAAYDFLLAKDELSNYKCFYKYSTNLEVKELLDSLINSKIEYKNLENILIRLNFLTNQEFCRVRTSEKYFSTLSNSDIYFRRSSYGFNWFNLIWAIVNNNKNIINSITVYTEEKVKGYDEFYRCHGRELNHLPVKDFLTLPRSPVIENITNNNKATITLKEELEFDFYE